MRIYNFISTNLNASKSPETNCYFFISRIIKLFCKSILIYDGVELCRIKLVTISTINVLNGKVSFQYFKLLMQSSFVKYINLTKVNFIFLFSVLNSSLHICASAVMFRVIIDTVQKKESERHKM